MRGAGRIGSKTIGSQASQGRVIVRGIFNDFVAVCVKICAKMNAKIKDESSTVKPMNMVNMVTLSSQKLQKKGGRC